MHQIATTANGIPIERLLKLPLCFAMYLERRATLLFARSDCHSCPAADWLSYELGTADVSIDQISVRVEKKTYETPEWLRRFIAFVDNSAHFTGNISTRLIRGQSALFCLYQAMHELENRAT